MVLLTGCCVVDGVWVLIVFTCGVCRLLGVGCLVGSFVLLVWFVVEVLVVLLWFAVMFVFVGLVMVF